MNVYTQLLVSRLSFFLEANRQQTARANVATISAKVDDDDGFRAGDLFRSLFSKMLKLGHKTMNGTRKIVVVCLTLAAITFGRSLSMMMI